MTIALDWPTQLEPIWTDDLGDYVAAIATMWIEVEVYQADADNDITTWQALFDVDIAPLKGLPWLAQCVGERLPVGIDEAGARNWIRQSPNWSRGTIDGIVDGVARVLVPSPGSVAHVRERQRSDNTPDVDYITVVTYTAQTPNPQAVRNQLRRTVPADIVWEYLVLDAATWNVVTSDVATWDELRSVHGPTWGDVSNPS